MSILDDLNPAQLVEFRRCFEEFDLDHSGTISIDELRVLMESFGHRPTDQELRDAVTDAGGGGDGEDIGFEEFCKFLIQKRAEVMEKGELREAFNALDKDGDGFLTKTELMAIDGVTEAEADQIIREADVNGDGKIDLEEFIAWK